MSKHTKKQKPDRKKLFTDRMNREGFIEYVRQHVDFMDVLHCVNGVSFLSICGYDGGDLQETQLEDGPYYCCPKEIDEWIRENVDYFKRFNIQMPEVSFEQFCQDGKEI